MNNPAIGTWGDVFSEASPEVVKMASALRDLIMMLHPASIEVARPGDKAVSFGFGQKKMSEAYVYLMPQRDRVNLGFYQGAKLVDPAHLLEGDGKALRHVKVRAIADVARAEIAGLISAAIAERRVALGVG